MFVHRFVFACLKLTANVGIFEVPKFEGNFVRKVVWWGVGIDREATADPPPMAKDDKLEAGGMVLGKEGRYWLGGRYWTGGWRNTGVSPLRFAPVEMTWFIAAPVADEFGAVQTGLVSL
jgi:hypothetical protein